MSSTKRYKLRASAVVALTVLVFGVAAIGVQAYEPCQRIVRKYVERVAPHHYSKLTLARWAQWGKEHPNYHPPKRQPLQPKEVLEKVNFDCEIPDQNDQIAGLLDPLPYDDELPLVPQQVAINTAPPVVPPPISLVTVPVENPVIAPIETAEPQSFIFTATGVLLVMLCVVVRRQRGKRDSFAVSVPAL